MLRYHAREFAPKPAETIRRDGDLSASDAVNELIGSVISCYERALEKGAPPSVALAAILGWASEECARLRPESYDKKA